MVIKRKFVVQEAALTFIAVLNLILCVIMANYVGFLFLVGSFKGDLSFECYIY